MIIDLSAGGTRAFAVQVSTPSLGDHSYLVVVDDEAALVDPQLDIERFKTALADSDARLRWVFETHVHNDYVSGGRALALEYAAGYVLPEDSGVTFDHEAIADGATRPLGSWRIRAMHTPGHTPHHTSYVLEAAGPAVEPGAVAVFSGGSMLVGAVGRSDLLGPDLTEQLARAQYRSVNRMADTLPDPTTVGPTHGAGSFCSATPTGSQTTTTIGIEKARNPALIAAGEDAFVEEQIAGYGLFPDYYAHMGPANRRGDAPATLPDAPPALTPHQLTDVAGRATLFDLRDARAFAGGHVAGSINVPMAQDAAAYIAWTLPWGAGIVLIGDNAGDIADVRLQLHRIGVRSIVGVVDDGLAAWRSEMRPLAGYRVATFDELLAARPERVVDARDPLEARQGALPGSMNIHFSRISAEAHKIGPGEVWVHCQSGYRAAIAASSLAAAGRDVVLVPENLPPRRLLGLHREPPPNRRCEPR